MIALTKEKREELANYARARLASHVVHGGCSDEEEIFKIALASLTAECKYFQWKWAKDENAVWTTTPIEKLSDAVSAFGKDGENVIYRMLFTAPPVPEMKLPSNLQDAFEDGNKIPPNTQRCGDSYCVSTFHNWKGEEFMHQYVGFLKGVNYVKGLNGWGE